MKDFIPYAESLALKELGFEEDCLMYWNDYGAQATNNRFKLLSNIDEWAHNYVECPTFSQAFRFFREKYNLEGWVTPLVDEQGFVLKYQSRFHRAGFSVEVVGDYDSSEEAELECLRRLISVVS